MSAPTIAAETPVTAMRNLYRNRGAFALARRHQSLAAKRARAAAQTHKSVAFTHLIRIKPLAVVGYLQQHPPAIRLEINFCSRALGMANQVVDCLLEHQEGL